MKTFRVTAELDWKMVSTSLWFLVSCDSLRNICSEVTVGGRRSEGMAELRRFQNLRVRFWRCRQSRSGHEASNSPAQFGSKPHFWNQETVKGRSLEIKTAAFVDLF